MLVEPVSVMRLEDVNQFVNSYFILFPLAGVPVYLLFWVFGKRHTRPAWYVAASAPGAMLLPLVAYSLFARAHPGLTAVGYLAVLAFLSVVVPALWLCPAVLFVQFRNMALRRWPNMTPESWFRFCCILAVYPWTHFVARYLDNF